MAVTIITHVSKIAKGYAWIKQGSQKGICNTDLLGRVYCINSFFNLKYKSTVTVLFKSIHTN